MNRLSRAGLRTSRTRERAIYRRCRAMVIVKKEKRCNGMAYQGEWGGVTAL